MTESSLERFKNKGRGDSPFTKAVCVTLDNA